MRNYIYNNCAVKETLGLVTLAVNLEGYQASPYKRVRFDKAKVASAHLLKNSALLMTNAPPYAGFSLADFRVYRQCAEKFEACDAGIPETELDIHGAVLYVLAEISSGAQKDVHASGAGGLDSVCAGLEAKGNLVVNSYRNPAYCLSNLETLNDDWQAVRNSKIEILELIEGFSVPMKRNTSMVRNPQPQLKGRGCFVSSFSQPSQVRYE